MVPPPELLLPPDVEVHAQTLPTTGRPYPFAPMSAMEPRVVHMPLMEMDGLRTESEGEGRFRHVVVFPAREGDGRRSESDDARA